MRRREFLGCALAWPLAARAQQRVPRIGYLASESAELDAEYFAAFRVGLRDLGWIEGETIEIVSQFVDQGEDRLISVVRDLIDLKVEVIATVGPGVYAAAKATKTVPIAACATGDLVGLGLAESLHHPGGNVTGESTLGPQIYLKRMEALKAVAPAIKNIGLLLPRGSSGALSYAHFLGASAKALGTALTMIEVGDLSECDRALTEGPGATIDGLVVTDLSPMGTNAGAQIVATAALRHGVPTAGALNLPRGGGLLGYGHNYVSFYRRCAYFVDKILRGVKPGDIPIEQATRFTMIVNLKAAATLGLEIPPAILASADEVIE